MIGIGFVSAYQITDAPIVRSLGVEIKLDPLHECNRVTAIDDIQGSEFELRWAFDGNSPIREALNASAMTREDMLAKHNTTHKTGWQAPAKSIKGIHQAAHRGGMRKFGVYCK